MLLNNVLIFIHKNHTKEMAKAIVLPMTEKATPLAQGNRQQDDHDLVRQAQAGDRQAFAVLAERHYSLMFKVAWQWCGNREDAEDIAQDAAIKLAQNIRSFQFESAFTTWLYRMVINAAKDYFKAKNRRNTREMPMFEDMTYISAEPTPEQQLADKDVLHAIGELPEMLKETVLLVCWQGLSHKEAGVVMDCPEGTVSWRVSEARKKIAEILDLKQKVRTHG
jgi:RNA polymerase sigma-70 factor, ECF subfamily